MLCLLESATETYSNNRAATEMGVDGRVIDLGQAYSEKT